MQLEQPGDQDLLFATVLAVPLLPLAPLLTRAGDYLGNRYYAVAPFEAQPVGRVRFRLTPLTRSRAGDSRAQRLQHTLKEAPIELALEYRRDERGSLYEPLCLLTLAHTLELGQNALRFAPFRTGRSVQPRGFLHHVRRPVYETGQRVRTARAR
jgi:hypothetical protein